jgi:hypothetical protein
MLPVFFWRMRNHLDPTELVKQAKVAQMGPAVGFFLETAATLGGSGVFDEAVSALASSAHPERPSQFFAGTSRRPFERAAAELNTPSQARRWGLLMNMSWESFSSYFQKVSAL